ncbi:hypothetical protein EPR50_G00042260 [Scomber scombrus]|uniref:Uncharacterized protein n=1 Tax=Scomber scombrus TaxID=13677 RepID=A0AAV1NGT8_SCOSC
MGDIVLSEFATVHEITGWRQPDRNRSNTEQSERRLLKIGLLILGVLCIIQATLNISMRLALYSKEDADQFPFNFSKIEEVCQLDQSQQNSTQFCFCCKKLLRGLLKENKALESERDRLQGIINTLAQEHDDYNNLESGSGSFDGSSE